ncbi:MAG: PilZ domain-containing protein [Myxococcota bacterium]
MAKTDSSKKRRFARAKESLPIKLTFADGKREFEATVYSADISVSGIFLATEFFLKAGAELDLEFTMPNDDRAVRTRGIIVREVRLEESSGRAKTTVSGFAMRFIEYYADAKTVLASAFLIVELDDFIDDYLERRSLKRRTEREQLKDVIVGWEVGKMDLSGSEEELLRGRINVDKAGRIIRRDERPVRKRRR